MDIEKSIEVLNTLVEINNDRIEGYEKASNETGEQDLKSLFVEFANTSHKCKNELVGEIYKLGGKPTEGTKMSGKFFRVWMDLKMALTGNDRKTILNLCEYAENMALETYEYTIKNNYEYLSVKLKSLIYAQKELLRSDQVLVKSLHDVLV